MKEIRVRRNFGLDEQLADAQTSGGVWLPDTPQKTRDELESSGYGYCAPKASGIGPSRLLQSTSLQPALATRAATPSSSAS